MIVLLLIVLLCFIRACILLYFCISLQWLFILQLCLNLRWMWTSWNDSYINQYKCFAFVHCVLRRVFVTFLMYCSREHILTVVLIDRLSSRAYACNLKQVIKSLVRDSSHKIEQNWIFKRSKEWFRRTR